MFNNSSKVFFMLILMLGTLVSISSNSWLSAWMGLEINLLAFIPLMTVSNNMMSSEASLKYFLTQALASSVMLFSIIFSMIKLNFIYQMKFNELSSFMILSSLLLKAGAAPFHFWFPSVMEGLSWMNNLLLMTWQKIAPLMLVSLLILKTMLYWVILFSVLIGSLGGLNQTSLRKIMAFSSINHIGWMTTAMIFSETLWMVYFLIYSFLVMTLVLFFNLFKLLHFNQLFNMFMNSKTVKFSLFMNFLSLGGLPPFIGFLPKWMVIQSLSINNQLFLMTLMTVLTLITLYFYIRMCYSAFLLNYYENNWNISMNYNYFPMLIYLVMSFISTFSLFSISLLYLII